jgi:4-methylaminobutanoate oxidase (formaldehyde-forming)
MMVMCFYVMFVNIIGPKSRELLQALTSHDVSDANYPFRTAREIDIGCALPLCTRITYVGELGIIINLKYLM